MNIARNQKGQMIYLPNLSEQEKEKLKFDWFYCPSCNEKMLLKKGKLRTWYFSHLSCYQHDKQISDIKESMVHRNGKQALYQWILKSTSLVQLEYTRKNLRQRPDVYCIFQNRSYAVEYQLAALDVNMLVKRTEKHIDSSDFPVWIIGKQANDKHKKRRSHMYPYKYLQDAYHDLPVLYVFDPPFQMLEVLFPLATFSANKIFFTHSFVFPSTSFFQALEQNKFSFSSETIQKQWVKEKKVYRFSNKKNPSPLLQFLFSFFPENQLSVPFLPPTVGVPTLFSFHLYSHCIEWQLWFQLLVLNSLNFGEQISIRKIKSSWCQMIQKGLIQVRPLPLIYRTNHWDALYAYMVYLHHLGLLHMENGYIQKKRIEKKYQRMEDILEADRKISAHAFCYLKNQLKIMVQKKEKG